jgi:hypothetical protein
VDWPIWIEEAWPTLVFRPEAAPGEVFSPVSIGDLLAKSDRPAAGGQWWSGRRASWFGGRPELWLKRGEGLTGRLLCGGGDQRQGKDGDKPE